MHNRSLDALGVPDLVALLVRGSDPLLDLGIGGDPSHNLDLETMRDEVGNVIAGHLVGVHQLFQGTPEVHG